MSIPRSLVRFASIAVVAALATVGSALPSSATDVNVSGVAVHEATAIGFAEGVEAAVNQSVGFEVECPADGECVAAGILTDAATPANQQVWVAVRYGGVWGMGQVVTFPAGSFLEGFIGGQELSCSGVGECDLVGNREGAAGGQLAFHARVANGVAQAAEWMTVAGVTTSTPEMTMVAAQYPGSGGPVGQRFQMSGGTWSAGAVLEAPAAGLGVSPMSVSCVSVGHCVIVAAASDGQNPGMATSWNYVQVGGAWQTPVKVAIVAGPAATDVMVLRSVRCVHGGYVCSAIGDVDRGGFTPASVESTGVAPEPAGVAPGPDGSHAVTQEIMFRAPEPIAPKYTG